MKDLTLCILIASGYERDEIPAKQAKRLDVLLTSIFENSEVRSRIIVSDDYSDNVVAQQECKEVCEKHGVLYTLNSKWTGPSGNYNNAVRVANTEKVALLGDDQYCTKDWWSYMTYFIRNNEELKWGMLGWSVIFAEDLVRVGALKNRDEFYTCPEKLKTLSLETLPVQALRQKWCNWDQPRLRGHCSGTAFVIKKSMWEKFGGFFEQVFQFDEDYGDNVWNLTDHLCVQIPTPPIIHYGGACAWPNDDVGPGAMFWRKGWEKRPFVPVDFDVRGGAAQSKISELSDDVLKDVFYKPLNINRSLNENLVLDLGCGNNLRDKDAIGVDIVGYPATKATVLCNLGFDPLPFPGNSCSKVLAHDILEHIPHVVWDSGKRRLPTVFLFNQVYRVLQNGGIFETSTPIYPDGKNEPFQDPTHASIWTDDTFNYFSGGYHGFRDIYGHTSKFVVVKKFLDGGHLHVWLKAEK